MITKDQYDSLNTEFQAVQSKLESAQSNLESDQYKLELTAAKAKLKSTKEAREWEKKRDERTISDLKSKVDSLSRSKGVYLCIE